ncbi:MAG: helix-turn-helix domain-containing protein [Phycisphaerales bacterium]|jgi:DNA-binding CsgD family transcriptional regulator
MNPLGAEQASSEMLAERFDPLIAVVDGQGTIISHRLPKEPTVVSLAAGVDRLDGLMPHPAGVSLMELIQMVQVDGRPRCAVLVMQGLAHELWTRPHRTGNGQRVGSVVLTLLPGGLQDVPRRLRTEYTRVPMSGHDWGPLDGLTRGEMNALRLISRGMTNTEAAQFMHRTRRAVEWHVRHLHRALGVTTRPALITVGRRAGLHCFEDSEWELVLGTRRAVRSRRSRDDGVPEHES